MVLKVTHTLINCYGVLSWVKDYTDRFVEPANLLTRRSLNIPNFPVVPPAVYFPKEDAIVISSPTFPAAAVNSCQYWQSTLTVRGYRKETGEPSIGLDQVI